MWCKDKIRNAIILDILLEILVEVSKINDVNLLERVKEVAWDGISKAILHDEHTTAILCCCTYLRDLCVATHKRTVGTAR